MLDCFGKLGGLCPIAGAFVVLWEIYPLNIYLLGVSSNV